MIFIAASVGFLLGVWSAVKNEKTDEPEIIDGTLYVAEDGFIYATFKEAPEKLKHQSIARFAVSYMDSEKEE